MQIGTIISLIVYFAAMLGIGVYAWAKSTDDSEGYLLGGRQLPPAVAALSAGASDMSGWLILGLPGALYASGLVEAWIGIGLFIGAFANWILVAPRLRQQTAELDDSLTIPEFLSRRFPSQAITLRVISALIIVVFFSVYTAAGLVGGGKLFDTSFAGLFGSLPQDLGGSDYGFGVWITAGVVLAYTMFGGFLAVSLTDFVQGCIMVVALVLMPIVATMGEGGIGPMSHALTSIDPNFLSITHGLTVLGFLSAITWGLGYFGQPHIIVRFMAIRSLPEVATARNIGMTWMGVAMLGSLGIGIAGRAFVERNGIPMEDPETIFIVLADLLFHPLITGFLLAALLAAIMSTISSQLLVASSSLTEDFYRLFFRKQASEREMVTVGRICVLLVAVVAALLAMDPNSEVLGLVSNAWAGFGAAFGPLILLSLTWKRMTAAGAVSGLVIGAAVVILWIALGWNESFLGGEGIYEIIPGFFAAMIAIVGVSLAGKAPEPRAKPLTQDPLET
ncbi:sodium/proline symporter PutP [Stakelama pacifica]|uniref:Sodium/proline symporter n=1 Tax=Stakelama pacifica TaxID=517720 RepID=A0A4R6FZ81_9SPHN|nr:sodium/proline symporter PutP [Stakelama pacifica]MAX00159.1 sodium/proline symporter PutP [Sphingomonas sp.]TDN86690.1 SSS family solute:Na+ symporter [Stakelama pacifica]GGO90385.1 osmoregulated proline transporter OpuE [Stakelama pacifica]